MRTAIVTLTILLLSGCATDGGSKDSSLDALLNDGVDKVSGKATELSCARGTAPVCRGYGGRTRKNFTRCTCARIR